MRDGSSSNVSRRGLPVTPFAQLDTDLSDDARGNARSKDAWESMFASYTALCLSVRNWVYAVLTVSTFLLTIIT